MRTRQSRPSCPSSWSWSGSCSPSQARLHHSQLGVGNPQHQHPWRHHRQLAPLVQSLAFPLHHGHILEAQKGHQLLSSLCHPAMQGNTQYYIMVTCCQQYCDQQLGRGLLWRPPHINPGLSQPAQGYQFPLQLMACLLHRSQPLSEGKIQWGEYVDLPELLAYDFQYQYSSLDESQALEVVDGKLSLVPKCRARHLSNLQLWLHAWHLYEDTVLSFYPYSYLELFHYQ